MEEKEQLLSPISDELLTLLEACETLPRPPGIAFRLVQRTGDPEATPQDIAQILASDPVLAGRIVGAANSPIYAQQGDIKRLDRAVTILGFQATRSTALSYTLLKSLKAPQDEVIDCQLFWRRSLLSAVAGRVLARATSLHNEEELFLTCLLQDIGILALSRAVPGMYQGVGDDQLNQVALIARERERFGADHGVVGAWLVEQWGFPEEIARGILGSHYSWAPSDVTLRNFIHHVALSSVIAEIFLERSGRRRFQALATEAERLVSLDKAVLVDIVRDVAGMLAEAESVFEMQILTDTDADEVIEEAQEAFVGPVPASS